MIGNRRLRQIVGRGPTKDLAEAQALLESCRALARLGLLVRDGAGTGGQDSHTNADSSDTCPTTSPFIVLFSKQHTKGFKALCSSVHITPPGPGAHVTLSQGVSGVIMACVSQFQSWFPVESPRQDPHSNARLLDVT